MTELASCEKIISSELINSVPSIKITKNTKGYNFEFKIISLDIEEMDRVHNAIVEKIFLWEKASEKIEVA